MRLSYRLVLESTVVRRSLVLPIIGAGDGRKFNFLYFHIFVYGVFAQSYNHPYNHHPFYFIFNRLPLPHSCLTHHCGAWAWGAFRCILIPWPWVHPIFLTGRLPLCSCPALGLGAYLWRPSKLEAYHLLWTALSFGVSPLPTLLPCFLALDGFCVWYNPGVVVAQLNKSRMWMCPQKFCGWSKRSCSGHLSFSPFVF